MSRWVHKGIMLMLSVSDRALFSLFLLIVLCHSIGGTEWSETVKYSTVLLLRVVITTAIKKGTTAPVRWLLLLLLAMVLQRRSPLALSILMLWPMVVGDRWRRLPNVLGLMASWPKSASVSLAPTIQSSKAAAP